METEAVLRLLVEVAEEIVNPRFRALAADEVDQKKPGDYVTIADRESEVALTRALRSAYPDAVIVGEEAAYADPAVLAALPGAHHAFVVDPVDGTSNFVKGSPDHAMMVGELRDGVPVRGWIWQPQHQVAWVAERGSGVRRNGEQVVRGAAPGRLAGRSSIGRVIGAAGPGLTAPIQASMACAGIDYPNLIAGEIDFIVYGANPKPWDHVPAQLMLSELGGVVRIEGGVGYRPDRSGRRVVAAAEPGAADLVEALVSKLLD